MTYEKKPMTADEIKFINFIVEKEPYLLELCDMTDKLQDLIAQVSVNEKDESALKQLKIVYGKWNYEIAEKIRIILSEIQSEFY